jgi:hypothetical protein
MEVQVEGRIDADRLRRAIAAAVRGWSFKNAVSPKKSPGPIRYSSSSRPSLDSRLMSTRPETSR